MDNFGQKQRIRQLDRQSLSQWTFYSFSMPLTIVHSVDNCGQIVHIMDNCLWYGQLYIPFCRLSMPWTQNTPIYQHSIDLLSWTNFIRKKSSWTLYFFSDPDDPVSFTSCKQDTELTRQPRPGNILLKLLFKNFLCVLDKLSSVVVCQSD